MRKCLSYFLAMTVALIMCACNEKVDSPRNVDPTPDAKFSSKCTMTKLWLQLAEAEEYAADGYYVQCQQDQNDFTAVNQKQLDLSSVKVKFEVSNKAKVYVVGTTDTLTSGVSTLNLTSGTVKLGVLAENKVNKNEYTVTVIAY